MYVKHNRQLKINFLVLAGKHNMKWYRPKNVPCVRFLGITILSPQVVGQLVFLANNSFFCRNFFSKIFNLTLSCPRDMSNFSKSLTMNWETTCDIPFKRYFLGCAINHTNRDGRGHILVRKVQNEIKKTLKIFLFVVHTGYPPKL